MIAGSSRRRFLSLVGAGAACSLIDIPAAALNGRSHLAAPRRTRLILLGTKGGPTPSPLRAAPANLLIVEGKPFVIDCGNGVAAQLVKAGVDLADLGDVFVTHHHADHNADLGTLCLLAWGSGLQTPINLYGPPPITQIVQASLASNAYDIAARIKEEGRPPLRSLIRTHEFGEPRTLIDRSGLKVRCVFVDHYTVPSVAYRFDTPDRSVVFSGDTTYSEALIALAQGADVLVHEAMYRDAIDQIVDKNAPDLIDHLLKSHTTTEQLGRIASEANVNTLVLSHLVPAMPTISDDMWIAGVRESFGGEIIVGRDLLEI